MAQKLTTSSIWNIQYTESAVAKVRYVDANTGKDIIPPKTIAGEVDATVNIDKQLNNLKIQVTVMLVQTLYKTPIIQKRQVHLHLN